MSGDLLDDLFHHCALVAFVEQARAQGTWPESVATRRRTYLLYEAELAAKNSPESPEPGGAPPAASRAAVAAPP